MQPAGDRGMAPGTDNHLGGSGHKHKKRKGSKRGLTRHDGESDGSQGGLEYSRNPS